MSTSNYNSEDRVQQIIRATFEDYELRKRAETAEPVDLDDAVKDIPRAPDGVQQPGMSLGPRKSKRAPGKEQKSRGEQRLDELQLGLDAVGIVEPTPFADGTNAAISVARGIADPERRSEHFRNAAISAVSMVPYVGDLAKIAKAPAAIKTLKGVRRAGDAAQGMKERRFLEGIQERLFGGGSTVGGNGGGSGSGNIPPGSNGGAGSAGDDDPEKKEKANRELDKWTDKLKRAGEGILSVFGPFGKIAAVSFGAIKSLELLNTGVLAVNRDLANFNSGLAAAYENFEADEIRRKIRKGEAIDGPAARLADQQSELKEHLDRFTNPMQAGLTQTLVYITQIANAALSVAEEIPLVSSALKAIEEKMKEDAPAHQAGLHKFFADLTDGKLDGIRPDLKGRPRRILSRKDHGRIFGDE